MKAISLKTAGLKANKSISVPRQFEFFSSEFNKEKEVLIESFSILLSSGLDVLTVLSSLQEEFRSKRMKSIMKFVIEQVENGSPLWEALDNTKIFPEYMIVLLKIGEDTGKLQENFKVISIQRKKEIELLNKIQSAAAYPLFVMMVAVIVLISILWFILPNLTDVFSGLGVELPLITIWIIELGKFMSMYGNFVVPALLTLIFLAGYLLFLNKKTKFLGQYFLFYIPVISGYTKEIELSRMGFYLGTLLGSGVPINNSISSLRNVSTFSPYFKIYDFFNEKIPDGYSFSQCFDEFKSANAFFPISTQNMIISGEKSGNLASVFLSIGSIYENKTDTTTKNLTVLLEPALLVVVWFAVATIAIGIILPIYSLVGSINSGSDVSNAPVATLLPQPTKVVDIPILSPVVTAIASTPEPTPSSTPVPSTWLIVQESSTGYVNIRENPGTNSRIITQTGPGEEFVYIAQKSGWYEIVLEDGKTAWISAQYIKVKK